MPNPVGISARCLVGLVLCGIVVECGALSRDDVVFYAPFDGALTAEIAVGGAQPVGERLPKADFVSGVIGQAVVTGTTLEDLIAYPVAGHLNERQGAVSLWFRPVDWRSGDAQQHLVFSIGGRLLFYHYWEGQSFCFWWMDGSTVLWGPGYLYETVTPDRWQHVVASWGNGKCTIYWNGKQRAEAVDMPASVPAWADGGTFRLAQPDWTRDRNNRTAIDELMIFRRPLAAPEVRSLYRRGAVELPGPGLRITGGGPGGITPARVTDFVDGLFGNLTQRRVWAAIGLPDEVGIEVTLDSEAGTAGQATELWLASADPAADCHRIVVDEAATIRHLVTDAQGHEAAASPDAIAVAPSEEGGRTRLSLRVPWSAVGLGGKPPEELRLNLVRRWSGAARDLVSWADLSRCPGGPSDPRAWGRLRRQDAGWTLALEPFGRLHYGTLALQAQLQGGREAPIQADIRLQPSDFREIGDPVTFAKTFSGTQLVVTPAMALADGRGSLTAEASFSAADIDCLVLRFTDAAGVIYAVQRPFVALPPVVATEHAFPRAGRLEVHADTSHYREAPLERLGLQVEVIGADGARCGGAAVSGLRAPQVVVPLPLADVPVGRHTVRTVLRRDGAAVSRFEAPFEKLAPGPWEGTPLGRDEVVLPPFTPLRVEGQSVAVWGRTYVWRDSLFPVQITSAGQELLAGPIELLGVAGATEATTPAGQATPATVTVVAHSPTRVVVECAGELGGHRILAQHRIEYDGMCLTRLRVEGAGELPGLTLVLPFRPDQSSLYHHFCNAGLVRGTTVRGRGVDLKGQVDLGFRNTLWLGNEDRGLTWFAESKAGWRLEKGLSELSVKARERDSLLLVRLANHPVTLEKPLDVTFGIIATPVKPMRDNWRFLRVQRDWSYTWCGAGGFTQSNNDITHVLPGWKDARGEPQTTYPILAYREFYKRLAVECWKRGRPYLLWVHCSNCLEMPASTWRALVLAVR